MKTSIRQLRSRRGRRLAFTLVEAIVGMGVAGITLLALYSGLTLGYSNLRMARENLRATQIILEKMEAIRLYDWEQLNKNGFVPSTFQVAYVPTAIDSKGTQKSAQGPIFNGTVSINDSGLSTNYKKNLKLVTVTLSWTTGKINRSRTMSTWVASDGLHSYIF